MCGRFALGLDQAEIRSAIGDYFPRLRGGGAGGEDPAADPPPDDAPGDRPEEPAHDSPEIPWEGEDRFRPKNWNVAPRSNSVVLRYRREKERRGKKEEDSAEADEDAKNAEEGQGELVLQTMQWGLIPHWSKHPPQGPLNTINARSENLTDPGAGGMWQSLKGYKRCVVVVEGYYEWQKKGTTKIPHFTRLAANPSSPNPLMLLAGLWDSVTYSPTPEDPHPTPHYTFTILTTRPSARLAFLHDRMPVILDVEGAERWMDVRGGWTDEVSRLCTPYEGPVECYPVQPEVGKVGTNSSSYVVPVAERKDGIASFFKKQEAASPAKSKAKPEKKAEPESRTGRNNGAAEAKTEHTAEHGTVHDPALAHAGSAAPKKELQGDGLDAGIGDDSNAPQDEKPSVKNEGEAENTNKGLVEAHSKEVRTAEPNKLSSRKRAAEQDDEVVVIDDDDGQSTEQKPPASKRGKKRVAAAASYIPKRQTRSSAKWRE